MKTAFILLLLILCLSTAAVAQQQVKFEDYFIDSTLRVDYIHTGDAKDEIMAVDQMFRQGTWAGNPRKLLDLFGIGHFYVKVYDVSSGALLYSHGYDTYFDEYRTTEPAAKGIKRSYHESVLVPYPKKPVRIVVETKDSKNQFHPIFAHQVDPADYHILAPLPDSRDKLFAVLRSGAPHEKLDIVFVAEGYTAGEEDTFKIDLQKYRDVLLSIEPYKSHEAQINITGVFRPSAESGVTQPREGIFKNTTVRSSFNALDTDRYLLTEENRTLRDIAAAVPYDVLCVMVNSPRYGGGGLYHDYTIFTTHNALSQTIFLHEFGHGFAGLGDEYYASDVSYVDFYPHGVEPVEPNLTALLDPSNLKWKDLVSPGVAIPTDWGKAEYDSLQRVMGEIGQKRFQLVASLRKDGASPDTAGKIRKELGEQMGKIRRRVTEILTNGPYKGKIGAFEGAGYTFQGLYRPSVNCMMFSNEQKAFCKVCERAVARMIEHYAGER